jgi:hypothetical protein
VPFFTPRGGIVYLLFRSSIGYPPDVRFTRARRGQPEAMDTLLFILVAAVAIVLLLAFVRLTGQRRRERALRRERLGMTARGHRQEADAHSAKAEELAPMAEEHRRAAEEHIVEARDLEDRAAREQRAAAFHGERASETEAELSRR